MTGMTRVLTGMTVKMMGAIVMFAERYGWDIFSICHGFLIPPKKLLNQIVVTFFSVLNLYHGPPKQSICVQRRTLTNSCSPYCPVENRSQMNLLIER